MTLTDTTPATEPDEFEVGDSRPFVEAVRAEMRDEPPADTKPIRPTTRAGRKAAAAARRASGKPDSAPKAKTTTPRKASLESRLAGALVGMGTMLTAGSALAGSEALGQDGLVIIQHSANMAAAINKVADQDPRVKAALEKMLTAGVWSGVAMVMIPVVLAICGNHGIIPPQVAAMLAAVTASEPEAAAA